MTGLCHALLRARFLFFFVSLGADDDTGSFGHAPEQADERRVVESQVSDEKFVQPRAGSRTHAAERAGGYESGEELQEKP